MDRITLKEYCKAKVSGKRVILWKALIFIFLGSSVASFFTAWFEPPIPEYVYSLEDTLFYFRFLFISSIVTMFITKPLEIGVYQYLMDFDKDEFVNNNVLFQPFRHIIKIFVLSLFVVIVCLLPLIILSLLAFISIEILPFAMFAGGVAYLYLTLHFVAIPYIFNDYSDKSIIQIMQTSSKMMKSHKMDYFVLTLSFFGWQLLAGFTCGIFIIWLMPYTSFTFAKFFLDIKETYANGGVLPEYTQPSDEYTVG